MYKLCFALLIVPIFSQLNAQIFPEVRTVLESKKVLEWAEPQDLKGLVYMGKVPVTWDNNSIAKPKMTCVLMGGNVLYAKQKGGYDAYSSYKIDLALVQKILGQKDKFKVLEKHSIEKGPQAFQNDKLDSWAKFENPRQQDEWVLIDGKISGESIKTFVITRANDTQWVLKTYENERIINYIIQVN